MRKPIVLLLLVSLPASAGPMREVEKAPAVQGIASVYTGAQVAWDLEGMPWGTVNNACTGVVDCQLASREFCRDHGSRIKTVTLVSQPGDRGTCIARCEATPAKPEPTGVRECRRYPRPAAGDTSDTPDATGIARRSG
jgi:hypothetical protein